MKQARDPQRRPRLEGQRLAELLDVAAELFIEFGFQAASTNVIAQRAGASKASLYSRYSTKEELFLAVLEHRMNYILEGMTATISQEAPVRDVLLGFGRQLLQAGLSEAQVALIRVVAMESGRFPQLAQRFLELGPRRGQKALSNYLNRQIQQGNLRGEDSQLMAQHFFGMVAGAALLFRLLGVAVQRQASKQLEQQLGHAVDAFLRAYAVSAP